MEAKNILQNQWVKQEQRQMEMEAQLFKINVT